MDANKLCENSTHEPDESGKRKRLDENTFPPPITSLPPQEPIKRIRHEQKKMNAKEADPNSLESIREKNKAISLDLKEKNRRIAFLEHKCKQLYQESIISESAFRYIDRQAKLLLNDLTAIAKSDSQSGPTAVVPELTPIQAGPSLDLLYAWKKESEGLSLYLPEWYISIGNQIQDENPSKEYFLRMEKNMQKWIETAYDPIKQIYARISLVKAEASSFHQVLLEQKQRAMTENLFQKDQLHLLEKNIATLKQDLNLKEIERHQACRDYDRLFEKEKSQVEKQKTLENVKIENCQKMEKEIVNERDSAIELKLERMNEMEKQIEKLQIDVSTLCGKLKTERASVADFVLKLEQANAVTAAMARSEASYKQEMEERIAHLMEEKTHSNDEYIKIRHKANDIQAHINDKWKKKLLKVQTEANKAKLHADELGIKIAALREKQATYSSYRDQLSELKAIFETVSKEKEALRLSVERLEKERTEARTRTETHETNVYKDTIYYLESRVQALQAALDALKSANSNPSEHEQTLFQFSARDEALQAQNYETRKKLEDTKLELAEAKGNESICREENDALIAEIENMNHEMNASRQSRKKLTQQLEDKRTLAKKLQSQLLKEEQAKAHCFEELTAVRLQVSSLSTVHRNQSATINSIKEALDAKEKELTQLLKHVESYKSENEALLSDRRKTMQEAHVATRSRVAELSMRDQQLREQERRPCTQCEKYKKQEEYQKNKHLKPLTAENASFSDLERLELQDLQKAVKCSVCQDRRKDVLITKCFHMFCKECIDINLKTRNRKCPSCKKMFGQDDVKSVWF